MRNCEPRFLVYLPAQRRKRHVGTRQKRWSRFRRRKPDGPLVLCWHLCPHDIPVSVSADFAVRALIFFLVALAIGVAVLAARNSCYWHGEPVAWSECLFQ